MAPTSPVVAPELTEVAQKLDALAAGDLSALALLRPALHRVVVAPNISAAVKTLVVHALLLLDDPRIAGTNGGGPLLLKIRKLTAAALSVDAEAAPVESAASRPQFSPDALLTPDIDRSLIEEFIVETREQLEVAEAALLALDSDPDDTDALEALFRALHSIKGTSAFLGVEHATELAHHSETLLTQVRSGAGACTPELSNLIFRAIDMLDAMLAAIDRVVSGDTAMVPDGYRELIAALRSGPGERDDRSGSVHRGAGQFRRLLSGEMSVRVRSGDLDRLASGVRELVLAHAMLARDPAVRVNPELARKAAFAERIAFELEELATELRTVAFSATLQRLARLARDAAYQSGKSIALVMEGEDVLVERVMADALADPLMHMVRNAIDHGLEPADERALAGKLPTGQIRIAAHRVGAELVIELEDDGRGIDPAQLVRVAVERGFLLPGSHPTEAETMALLFRPGFSTARVVTDLSGRGVGMDVVRTNVEAVGGTIEIASRPGEGTTFTIRLPFRSRPPRNAQQTWIDSKRSIELSA